MGLSFGAGMLREPADLPLPQSRYFRYNPAVSVSQHTMRLSLLIDSCVWKQSLVRMRTNGTMFLFEFCGVDHSFDNAFRLR